MILIPWILLSFQQEQFERRDWPRVAGTDPFLKEIDNTKRSGTKSETYKMPF